MTSGSRQYTIFYGNIDGDTIDIIRDYISLEYTLTENDYGSLYLDLPPIYPKGYFKIDGRLEVLRASFQGDSNIEGGKPYFIRLVREKYDEDGKKYIHILAYDAIHLISRRIIAYTNNNTYTLKNGAADSLLVELFRENCGDLVTNPEGFPAIIATRSFPTNAQFFHPAAGQAATVKTDDMSRQLLLPRMQEISEMSRKAGYYLSFDYILRGNKDLQFTTYVGQRGSNHGINSPTQLKFTVLNNNLSYSSVEWDHTETKNMVYAGGRGQDNNRCIETEADYEAWKLSPFNRIEDWIDVDTEDPAAAADEAAAVVKARAPKLIFNGHIAQTPDCMYGIHYKWGDIVTVVQDDTAIDVHLDTATIKVSPDTDEDISIMARNYDEGEY